MSVNVNVLFFFLMESIRDFEPEKGEGTTRAALAMAMIPGDLPVSLVFYKILPQERQAKAGSPLVRGPCQPVVVPSLGQGALGPSYPGTWD